MANKLLLLLERDYKGYYYSYFRLPLGQPPDAP